MCQHPATEKETEVGSCALEISSFTNDNNSHNLDNTFDFTISFNISKKGVGKNQEEPPKEWMKGIINEVTGKQTPNLVKPILIGKPTPNGAPFLNGKPNSFANKGAEAFDNQEIPIKYVKNVLIDRNVTFIEDATFLKQIQLEFSHDHPCLLKHRLTSP